MTKAQQIEEKIKQLKARLAAENNKEAARERKQRTRLLIQVGAMLMADESQKKLLDGYLAKIKESENTKKAKNQPKEKV